MLDNSIFERVLSRSSAVLEEEPTVVVETTQGDEQAHPPVVGSVTSPQLAVTPDNLFKNLDTHPILLDLVLLRKYGDTWLGLEMESLVELIKADFRTQTVSDVNLEKIQACRALHLVDDFWLRWEVFLPCCAAFNGYLADFDHAQSPDVAECMVAVDIANRLRDDVTWSSEVAGYLACVHRYNSELCPQAPLDFVQVDTTGLSVDCAEVARRWTGVRAEGKAPTGNSVEDEQLRRMLGSLLYLESARSKLRSQLPVLKHV
jgi:hypothetical protein